MLITMWHTYLIIWFYTFHGFHQIYCANILMLAPVPSKSHSAIVLELAKALVQKGHKIDVVSHFPLKEPIEGYNDISIKGSTMMLTDQFDFETVKSLNDAFEKINHMKFTGVNVEAAFYTPQLQELKNSTKKYDLVIGEFFLSRCLSGWAWHFAVPMVWVVSTVPLSWQTNGFGLPNNPSYIPTYHSGHHSKMSFYERIMNTWDLVHTTFWYNYKAKGPIESTAKKFFGEGMPSLDDLAYNSSLMLLNTHFSIVDARPLPPNVLEVGGIHISNPEPLSEHFNKLLDTDLQGVIYFSLGSLVAIHTYPDKIIQDIFDAMAQLPYKVLFRGQKEKFSTALKIPSNIHFEVWMPQLDVLCDSRVKLFVSHGGMMGIQEAVYCGVPVLGIPLFADQKTNLKQARIREFGLTLKHISKNVILKTARKLLQDPKYKRNAKMASEEFKDRPMSAKDTAVYWIEYVLRYNGAPRLQCAAKFLPWYQYHLIDVIFTVIAVPCVLLYVITLLFKAAYAANTRTKKIKSH